jgi:hypothetical protein
MAQIDASKVALQKYGEAANIKFGTPYVEGFVVVESVSATHSFQSNATFKNEVGISVGQMLTDPKMDITINGIAEEQVQNLGAVVTLSNFVSAVEGAGGGSGSGASNDDVIITSVKQDNSNEDFMKFELTGERYLEIDPNTKKEVQGAEF